MPDALEITNKLLASGVTLVGDLVQDAGDENKYYAFTKVIRDDAGAQRPSNHALRKITDSFNEVLLQVTFILVEDDREDILANVKAMLLRTFPEFVRNVFPTFGDQGVVVWVEPKKLLQPDEEATLISKSEEFLEFLNTPLVSFHITTTQNIPTRTACLNLIRLHSPLDQQRLRAELLARGFHIPSDDWLSNMLDKLRKADFILRRKNGQYTLTLFGLEALGSAKNRRSPDIVRALDIARRGA